MARRRRNGRRSISGPSGRHLHRRLPEEAEGLRRTDDTLVGWGWMLWDWNWFCARTARSTVARVTWRVSAGDIIVMHDGDESAPRRDQHQTVAATASLIPELRARGFAFAPVCQNGG